MVRSSHGPAYALSSHTTHHSSLVHNAYTPSIGIPYGGWILTVDRTGIGLVYFTHTSISTTDGPMLRSTPRNTQTEHDGDGDGDSLDQGLDFFLEHGAYTQWAMSVHRSTSPGPGALDSQVLSATPVSPSKSRRSFGQTPSTPWRF
jgi:hypothetical protein